MQFKSKHLKLPFIKEPHLWIHTPFLLNQFITLHSEITFWDSLHMVLRMLFTQLPMIKLRNSIATSMLEKISLFLEQEISMVKPWITKSAIILDLWQPQAKLKFQIQNNLTSLLLYYTKETMKCSILLFQLLSKHQLGVTLTSSQWTISSELLVNTDAINLLETT